jgi:hypothetical protein
VKGEPLKYIFGHQHRTPDADYLVDEHGCWLWQKAKDRRGYGRLRNPGGTHLAHRYFYELEHGPIADPCLTLHHTCRNHACVNPQHMELIAISDHSRMHAIERGGWDAVNDLRRLRRSALSE